jgi:hypothetical protein
MNRSLVAAAAAASRNWGAPLWGTSAGTDEESSRVGRRARRTDTARLWCGWILPMRCHRAGHSCLESVTREFTLRVPD